MGTNVVITVTGDREQAFACCQKYHERWKEPHNWIVVQNAGKPYDLGLYRAFMRLPPDTEKIVIMEDDDWYGENHLRQCLEALDEVDMYGQAPDICYNVRFPSYANKGNETTAALASTAFRVRLLPLLLECLDQYTARFLDFFFWTEAKRLGYSQKLSHNNQEVIGIKGMPGRGGLGYGHDRAYPRPDPAYDMLHQLVGGEDAQTYMNLSRLMVMP